jgi:DNA-binding FadR family transcriptional regulator
MRKAPGLKSDSSRLYGSGQLQRTRDARSLDFVHNEFIMEKLKESSTVSEQAFQSLRQDVLKGAYGPGSKLKVESLQTVYGFSSSPLREALARLAQEGLVRADERRGFRVAPADRAGGARYRMELTAS